MANPITTKILFSLLLSLLLVSSSLASSDVPFIVAHKKATPRSLKSGAERVSVSIDIYNQGSSTAYDITLTDDHWPKDIFDVVSGNTSQSWDRLDAGGLLSHAFELEAKVKGMFHGSPAIITFRIPTKAALQEAYSTPILPLDVLAEKPPVQKLELVSLLLESQTDKFISLSLSLSLSLCCLLKLVFFLCCFMGSPMVRPKLCRQRSFWLSMGL
ncbi:translocon-associated protein subunit beta [Populus alba x Populus x berolinensis]|nr:translocon-associated protein subunit beta [Populus alba x Populus x berolinensis]